MKVKSNKSFNEYIDFCKSNKLKPSKIKNLEIFYVLNYKRGV